MIRMSKANSQNIVLQFAQSNSQNRDAKHSLFATRFRSCLQITMYIRRKMYISNLMKYVVVQHQRLHTVAHQTIFCIT